MASIDRFLRSGLFIQVSPKHRSGLAMQRVASMYVTVLTIMTEYTVTSISKSGTNQPVHRLQIR